MDVLRVAKLLGDSVDQVIETYGHLMPENLADAVAMIDPQDRPGRAGGPLADEVAAMRAEIEQVREELQAAKAAERTTARRQIPAGGGYGIWSYPVRKGEGQFSVLTTICPTLASRVRSARSAPQRTEAYGHSGRGLMLVRAS